jgi:cytochrome c oxidase assembly protein subunit 15
VSGQVVALVSRDQARLARLVLVSTAVVVTFGTLVTSTGPHGGSPQAPRFDFSLHDVAQLHGSSADVLVLLVAVTLGLMMRSGVAPSVLRRGEWLLAAVILQGAIGYSLYFLGDPAALTEVHVIGAVAVVLAVLRFNLGLAVRSPLPASGRQLMTAPAAGGRASLPTSPTPVAGS